jgi:ribosomal protein S17
MANTFLRHTSNAVGTTPAVVYTVGSGKRAVIIGGVLSNTTTGTVKVEVTATSGSTVINLTGENTVIPAASALSFVDGKIVVEAGDIIKVTSDTPTSVDVHLSVMEID